MLLYHSSIVTSLKKSITKNPPNNIKGDLNKINWKSIFKDFKEFNIKINDSDNIKLIRMDPGTSAPPHSNNGKEYILVLEGVFCDEYREDNKGDMQINDKKIKHNPSACKNNGCFFINN